MPESGRKSRRLVQFVIRMKREDYDVLTWGALQSGQLSTAAWARGVLEAHLRSFRLSKESRDAAHAGR